MTDRLWQCPACMAVNAFEEAAPKEMLCTCETCEEMYLPSAYEMTWEKFSQWCRDLKG